MMRNGAVEVALISVQTYSLNGGEHEMTRASPQTNGHHPKTQWSLLRAGLVMECRLREMLDTAMRMMAFSLNDHHTKILTKSKNFLTPG